MWNTVGITKRRIVTEATIYALDELMKAQKGSRKIALTLNTAADGIVIPFNLKAQYPDRMMIILQHSYSDIKISEDLTFFEITLSFQGRAHELRIPFDAVIGFQNADIFHVVCEAA